jgi:4,5-dihydroxyphthalate decarboxylase
LHLQTHEEAALSKLALSIATGDYDRTRPLLDGTVQIDGVAPVCMTLSPEEIFFRAFRHQEFDISELSFSSYLVKLSRGDSPYVGVPVFLSRAFRHTAIYVRTDRIRRPEDLKGCRVGVPEYQLSAIVWARALLQDEHGVSPADMTWVRGGIDTPGRPEKIQLQLPPDIRIEAAPEGDTISAMLERGDVDAFIAPRPPAGFGRHPHIGWLYPDPTAAAKAYYQRSGIFPIMHLVGIRQELVARHPWLPVAVFKAFSQAKALAMQRLADPSAPKVSLPFLEEQLKATRELMGEDYWAYGVPPNLRTLEAFARHHHAQGLSSRLLKVEELFHPSTYETARI